MEKTIFSASQLRFGGVAAMLVAPIIITLAILGDSHGIFFFDKVLEGEPVLPWIQNVLAAPGLSKILMVLPVLGFSCFLATGWVLYQYIPDNIWQKNLGIVGYLIGVPVAVVMWILQLSLMNHLVLNYGHSPEMDAQINGQAALVLYFFSIINAIFGPFFIIVVGSGMMAWAALKAGIFPKWLCYWAIVCAIALAISFLGMVVPELFMLGLFAPLHMIWFSIMGYYLWKKSKA